MSQAEGPSLRGLLLHRLPDSEAQSLEERVMLEEGWVERLREAENDLLDDYANDRLTAVDRADVERHLLATESGRQRLQLARALSRISRERREQGSSRDRDAVAEILAMQRPARGRRVPRWAAPAGALLAACFVLVMVAPMLERWRHDSATDSPLTITLLTDMQRGSTERTLRIDAAVKRIRLQLETADRDELAYRLSILDESGREIFGADDLKARVSGPYSFIETLVPAHALSPGSRTVILSPIRKPATSSLRWRLRSTIG